MASRLRLALLLSSLSAGSSQTVRLSNGVEMPSVGLGTWEFNNSEVKAVVQDALAVGFKHIDCAHNYNNQVGIGAGLAASGKKRNEVFITSKVPGCGIQGLGKEDCFGNTMKFIRDDIRDLSSSGFPLKQLDLLLIHFPPCMEGNASFAPNPFATPCRAKRNGCSDPDNCRAIAEQWRAAELAYRQGLVRAIGVSDYCSACFKCLGANATVMPMLNNVQFHIGMGPDPQGARSLAERREMVLMAWSPLGHGDGSTPIFSRDLPMKIAKAHGKTGAQVALKWILSHNVTLTTKSGNPKHLAEDIDLFDWELSAADVAALDADQFAHSEYDTPSFMCNDPDSAIIL